MFLEVDMRYQSVGDEGERGRRRTDYADIASQQRDLQAEKTDGHEADADHEAATGGNATNHSQPAKNAGATTKRWSGKNLPHRRWQLQKTHVLTHALMPRQNNV
jgi:hypothetical protein